MFRNDSGVAAVEFALVLPILCLVLLGIIDGWSFVS
ncbi:MAG: pilus assembly protein, partial [Mesorhizobium sp.]